MIATLNDRLIHICKPFLHIYYLVFSFNWEKFDFKKELLQTYTNYDSIP